MLGTRGRALAFALLGLMATGCGDEIPAIVAPPRVLERGTPPLSAALAQENATAGTRDWYSPPSGWSADSDLAVWASPYSVRAGDSLSVFVHARYGPVRVQLFRLGYYSGLGGRQLFARDSVPAGPQPPCGPSLSGVVRCPWTRTTVIKTDSAWRSGLLLVKVTDTRGKTWSYPLVLKDGRRAAILAIIPQFTWQAYNAFGGTSLYTKDANGRLGTSVSFERPYKTRGGGTYMYGLGYSNDISAVHWLEKRRLDVTYVSDGDLAASVPDLQSPTRVVMITGHGEYWTWNEYSFVQKLRDSGTHLMFLGANNAYWNVRPDRSDVTGQPAGVLWCYKEGGDPWTGAPEQFTAQFRSAYLKRPENGLYGVMHFKHGYGTYPLVVSDSAMGAHAASFLSAAGLTANDTLPSILTLGTTATSFMSIEGDQITENGYTPRGVEVLFHADIKATDGTVTRYHTTFFIANSGAGVFASGFNEWGRWLDDTYGPSDPRILATSDAVLDWMLAH